MSYLQESLFITHAEFTLMVREELDRVEAMLLRKNKAYGNSALEPIRIFSKSSPIEQLFVRIDDKLSRLKCGTSDNEDTVFDLIGYLVLLRVALRVQGQNANINERQKENAHEESTRSHDGPRNDGRTWSDAPYAPDAAPEDHCEEEGCEGQGEGQGKVLTLR